MKVLQKHKEPLLTGKILKQVLVIIMHLIMMKY